MPGISRCGCARELKTGSTAAARYRVIRSKEFFLGVKNQVEAAVGHREQMVTLALIPPAVLQTPFSATCTAPPRKQLAKQKRALQSSDLLSRVRKVCREER